MKILITGATGLVGKSLLENLFIRGYSDINIVTRRDKVSTEDIPFPVNIFKWNPDTNFLEAGALNNVDVVIHLAGESVAESRWSKRKKESILSSRLKSTRLLLEEIKRAPSKPKKFISASAIGIYGERGSEVLNEESIHGTGFLADVCKEWEDVVQNHTITEMKSHSIRIGIVLAEGGGALKKMLPPFKTGVAGILGNGKQFMSWIHIDDLVGQFIFLMENNTDHHIYNGVAPSPVSNHSFTKILGKIIRRPTLFPIPAFGLKILFGEMSNILLASQNVRSSRFIEAGFQFRFIQLEDALKNILGQSIKGEKKIKKYQWIDEKTPEVFSFFSNIKNLEKITPKYLNFKVEGMNTNKIQSGSLIDYSLKLHGIPLRWKTRINEFEEHKMFIDEQLNGPYSKWIHTHHFFSIGTGTLIKDVIIYKIPLGFIGSLFAGSFIKNDLRNIFNYRQKVIGQFFNEVNNEKR
jgi:uncharacterized protein